MNEYINNAQRRALRYEFVDGLTEIGSGLVCILIAGAFLILQAIPQTRTNTMIFFGLLLIPAYGIRWIMRRIKERTTYPRTGFVEYHSKWNNMSALAAAIVFTLLLLAIEILVYFIGTHNLVWGPIVGGLIFAFLFASIGYQTQLSRYFFLALLALIAGGGLALSGWGDLPAAAVLTTLIGVILFGMGLFNRRAYLRANPINPEANDGR